MNNLNLTGRLVRPAALRNTGEKARATFTLAVDGFGSQPTSWIPVTCFGRTAENVAEYTDKGHLVAIEGRITSGKYVFQGNFNGFQIWDASDLKNLKLRTLYTCPGGQGDMSVYKNLLFMSVEETRGRVDCAAGGVKDTVSACRSATVPMRYRKPTSTYLATGAVGVA